MLEWTLTALMGHQVVIGAYMCVCMHVHVCVYVCVHVCVHVHVCVCVCILCVMLCSVGNCPLHEAVRFFRYVFADLLVHILCSNGTILFI